MSQPIRAVIFDMDGVVSDTQRIHAAVESEILAEYGIHIAPDDISARFAGISGKIMFATYFSEASVPMPDIEKLAERKSQEMFRRADQIIEVPGTRDFIEYLARAKVPMAIASASHLGFISLVVDRLNVRDFFSALTSSREVQNGKPAPDVFLLAAERIGVPPSQCLVIEDGVSGMQAARAAGMRCVGLVREGASRDVPADYVTNILKGLTLEQLQ